MTPLSTPSFMASFTAIQHPVLVVSSLAGKGNFSVGEVLTEELRKKGDTSHIYIEHVLPADVVRTEFERHRILCRYSPLLLYPLQLWPFFYQRKKNNLTRCRPAMLEGLKDSVAGKFKTVIAVNHRSAFYLSGLKKWGEISADLWAVITDYALSQGWRHLFEEEISAFLGPLDKEEVPASFSSRFHAIPIPTSPRYRALREKPGDKKRVLITGGGWGLGPLFQVTQALRNANSDLTLEVACGTNQELKKRLDARFSGIKKVVALENASDLVESLGRCGSIICRPGAVTLTEAYQAGRPIFTLPGLPIIEKANERYAWENFGARRFSVNKFLAWLG